MIPEAFPKKVAQKIIDRVLFGGSSECWEWVGPKNDYGYGRVYFNGSSIGAHRVFFQMLTKTKLPKTIHIDHLCRNRACVNPNHMRAVTPVENTFAHGSKSISNINRMKKVCPKCFLPYDRTRFDRKGRKYRRCSGCDARRDALKWLRIKFDKLKVKSDGLG